MIAHSGGRRSRRGDERRRDAAGWPDLRASLAEAGYEVVRVLGQGGSGVVLEAKTRLGRAVAVKVLRPSFAAREDSVRRFFREARVASCLRHPGLVDVFETGWAGRARIPFLAMERLRGRSLLEALGRQGAFPLSRAGTLTFRILDALEVLHANGIVHRDLKPANVFLVGREEEVKLLDLGISKIDGGDTVVTRAGQLLGTPGYMAPEQLVDSSRADPRSDLWAVGAILFELLSGRPPFDEAERVAALRERRSSPPPPLAAACPGVDPGVAAVVDRCLQHDPSRRWPSCAALREALQEATSPTRGSRRDPFPPAAMRETTGDLDGAVTVVRAAQRPPGPLVWAIALVLAALVGLGLAALLRG